MIDELKYIPFTFDDKIVGKRVIFKLWQFEGIIISQTLYGVTIGGSGWYFISYEELLKNYVFEDKSPCGRDNNNG